MANTRVGVCISIVYLFLIIFCFVDADTDEKSFTISATEQKVELDCKNGEGIVLLSNPDFLFSEKPNCNQHFDKSKKSHTEYVRALSTICVGRQRCLKEQLTQLTILTLSCNNHLLPADVRVVYECKPAVPDDITVFQIQTRKSKRHIDRTVYLIMNGTSSDTMNGSCQLNAENSRNSVNLNVLSLQFPDYNDCLKSVRLTVDDGNIISLCTENSSFTKRNVGRNETRPITLEVSVSSGFLWLEFTTDGFLEINCTGFVKSTRPTAFTEKTTHASPKTTIQTDDHTLRKQTRNQGVGKRESNETEDEESQNPNWQMIGSIIGAIIGLLIIVLICVLVFRHRSRKRQKSTVLDSTEDANQEYMSIDDSKVCTTGARPSPVTNICSKKARPANTSDKGDACYSECEPQHYSSGGKSSPSKSPLIQGTPYDTMATLEGEYSHLKGPGESEKVICNVYDG